MSAAQSYRNARRAVKRNAKCQAPGCNVPLDFRMRSTRRYCSDACRQLAHRRRTRLPPPVLAVQHGDNATLIAAAAKLYIRDGDTVADVTYGRGVFWKKTGRKRFHVIGSDLIPRVPEAAAMDFRKLTYKAECFDHLVLDPPYQHNPSDRYEHLYAGQATTKGLNHAGIIALYRQGMREAQRVLRLGGLLWVKCKDETESGQQRWAHIELHAIATELGMVAVDKFYLTNPARLLDRRWPTQAHARKNVSFLWIFRKATGRRPLPQGGQGRRGTSY